MKFDDKTFAEDNCRGQGDMLHFWQTSIPPSIMSNRSLSHLNEHNINDNEINLYVLEYNC